ncbi:MAG: sulfotransferase [Paracoccaceae bacterium]|nr:MAG: sulfotransferase [Paracoccaceae bacterium]
MVKIVYILGTTRSGTSAIRNALATTRYKGYGEGHLIDILTEIISVVRREARANEGAKVAGNGVSALRERVLIRHFFHGYERYLVENLGSSHLLDKTPNIHPIAHAPDLLAFHQHARFIHCARRHVDNLQSKRKKFRDKPFANQCTEWAECHRAWERVKPQLGNSYIEFDHHDLVTDREGTCRSMAELLELDEAETQRMIAYLESERPQATAPGADLDRFLKFSEIDWSEEDKDSFLSICGPVGDKLGYGLETYFA